MLRRNPADTLTINHPLTGEPVRLTRLHLAQDMTIPHPLASIPRPIHLPAGTLGGWVSDDVIFDDHSFIGTGIILIGSIDLHHSTVFLDDADHAHRMANRITSGTASPDELSIIAPWPNRSMTLHRSQLHADKQLVLTGLWATLENFATSGDRVKLTGTTPGAGIHAVHSHIYESTADLSGLRLRFSWLNHSHVEGNADIGHSRIKSSTLEGSTDIYYSKLQNTRLISQHPITIRNSHLENINVAGHYRLDNYDLTYRAATGRPALTLSEFGTLTRLTLRCDYFEYTLPVYIHADSNSSTVFALDQTLTLQELQALLDDPVQVRRTLGLNKEIHEAAAYRKALAHLRQDIGQLLWRELNI